MGRRHLSIPLPFSPLSTRSRPVLNQQRAGRVGVREPVVCIMPRVRLAWLGRRHWHRRHREQATGRFSGHSLCLTSSLPRLAWLVHRRRPFHWELASGRFSTDSMCAPLSSFSIQKLALQPSGTEGEPKDLFSETMFTTLASTIQKEGKLETYVHRPLLRTAFGCLPNPCKSYGSSLMTNAGRSFLGQARNYHADNECVEDENNEKPNQSLEHGNNEQPLELCLGDVQALSARIASEVKDMNKRVDDFSDRYRNHVRPMLAARCLLAPHGLNHPSTVFLHHQTYQTTRLNPSYLSSFDIMSYEVGTRDDEEFMQLLQHMFDKKVYAIEDFDLVLSTIETLVYDYGVKLPEDGTGFDTHRGELDASFDGKGKANLSFIIWKDDKIECAVVYNDIRCSSATEAEIFAAFALLSKAKEINASKLQICSDCKPVIEILSGELKIDLNHRHRNLYLMLRSMRRHFKTLIAVWKPREMMGLADYLARTCENYTGSIAAQAKTALDKYSALLKGTPKYRIERTKDTNKKISKFAKAQIDESYSTNKHFTFFVEVDDEKKYDCLLCLKQSLCPNQFTLCINDLKGKSATVQSQLGEFVDSFSERKVGQCSLFTDKGRQPDVNVKSKTLVVVLDAIIPKEVYYADNAFHIVLVTPGELKIMSEQNIPELTALTFLYFNEVNGPQKKSEIDEKVGKKDNNVREEDNENVSSC